MGVDGALFGGKKTENLTSEKRSRFTCKGVAVRVVTLRARYRRILLSLSLSLTSPNVFAMHL